MASDVFLKLSGVTGESVDSKHKGEIEIDSFSWSGENPTTIGSATGGAGAGKIKFNELLVRKRYDKSSPPVFANLAAGMHYKDAVLTVRKSGGEQQEYLTWTMHTVFTTKYAVELSEKDLGVVHEVLTFVFGQLVIEYKEQKADGSLGGGVKQGWDQITNKKT